MCQRVLTQVECGGRRKSNSDEDDDDDRDHSAHRHDARCRISYLPMDRGRTALTLNEHLPCELGVLPTTAACVVVVAAIVHVGS